MKEYIVSENSYEYEMRRYDELSELIRCKNCEHHRDRINMCDIWHRHTSREGYCHRAKKKHQEG